MTNMTTDQMRQMMKTHKPVERKSVTGAKGRDGRPVVICIWQKRR